MRFRPANISLINRRHYLPRLLLTLSSKYNDKNNPSDLQMLTGHTISGTEDLWVRLKAVVAHMVERLNEPESRFHASLVTNICDLVDVLPRLNVNQDEELNRFAEEIRNRLCGFTARELKKNEILRAATVNDAAQILTEMDVVLRERQLQSGIESSNRVSADDIFAHMAAYMEAPAS